MSKENWVNKRESIDDWEAWFNGNYTVKRATKCFFCNGQNSHKPRGCDMIQLNGKYSTQNCCYHCWVNSGVKNCMKKCSICDQFIEDKEHNYYKVKDKFGDEVTAFMCRNCWKDRNGN